VTRTPSSVARKKLVVSALEDIKATDILAIDVRKLTGMFDWIVVASAESARQTKALARHVRDKLKAAGSPIVGVEGEESAEWVLVDTGDIVVHIMQPAVRAYYNLEELWGEGKADKIVSPAAPLERLLPHEVPLEDAPAPKRRRAPARKASAPKDGPEAGGKAPGTKATGTKRAAPRARKAAPAATGAAAPRRRRRTPDA